MKKVLKIILPIVLFIFIAIQFYQPALNVNKGQVYETDFEKVYDVPLNVQSILQMHVTIATVTTQEIFGIRIFNLWHCL
jgi:hypothetical protein